MRVFQSNWQEKRKRTLKMITYFPTPNEKKKKKKKPTNNVVIRGRRLSFPRKITTFHTLVSQQEGLEREKIGSTIIFLLL